MPSAFLCAKDIHITAVFSSNPRRMLTHGKWKVTFEGLKQEMGLRKE